MKITKEKWDGVPIPETTIDRWIREQDRLCQEDGTHYIASGDSIVIAHRDDDGVVRGYIANLTHHFTLTK